LVEWTFPCKDANQVLITHGKEKLRECIENAKPIPIEGAFEINDIRDEVFALYDNGTPNGVHPGWDKLNEFYRPRLGSWTAVIAMPGSGKTAWMAALMVNLAARHNWKFAVFPAENLPAAEYASMLAEIYIGLPFSKGPTERMGRADLSEALDWLQDHFVILNPVDAERDLDSLISIGKAYCFRRGINGFVIDPWNELDHLQPPHQTETQYVAQSLIRIRQFAKSYNVHVWVVVHPTKLAKDKEGNYPVPTLYDASGSAHWRNKCDYGISLYRHFDDDAKPTEVHIQKVRWKWCGKLGMAELYFDKLSGRYSETPNVYGVPTYSDHYAEDDGRYDRS
jgi:twinkle protein